MTIRRMIVLTCLLLFPLCASAQPSAQIYVIKKGDTLWGISDRFLKDPYYWPNLWANNPDVRNPHFIYPGQKVAIYDGRIEIIPAEPAELQPETSGASVTAPGIEAAAAPGPSDVPAPHPVEPVAAVTIRTMGGARGFIGRDELKGAGTLIDTVDNRILMAEGERVFVKLKEPAAVGDHFSLFEQGKKIEHPVTGKKIGYEVIELGALQITEIGPKVATAFITDSLREIQRGAKLRPYQPPVKEIELKRGAQARSGYVIAGGDGKITLSQFDVVFIDIGAEEGLEVGNLLYISRQRKATELAIGEKKLKLPDVLLGNAVVLDTRPHTAAALILKSADSIFRGDKVTIVTE